MIFSKQALLALGVACAASPFSRVGAVRGDAKSPLDPTARKLDAKAGKESSSTGGEHSTSKGGKNPPNSSKAHKEEQNTPFFVASAACAQKCMSAEFGPDTHLLTNAIQHCDAQSSRQMWHSVPVPDSTFVKVKSVIASGDSTNGWCLGPVPQVAGALGAMRPSYVAPVAQITGEETVVDLIMKEEGYVMGEINPNFFEMAWPTGDGYEDHDMCSNGSKLGLVSCDNPSSQWYSTDGQLISPYCLSIGLSSFLSVNEGCTDLQLSTTSYGAASAPDNGPYKAGIIAAITELKDSTGSSFIAIKEHMQGNNLVYGEFNDSRLTETLEEGVAAGTFVKVKASYKLSASANTADGATAISRAETFMAVTQAFVETIPPPPAPTDSPTSNPTTATYTPTGAPMEPTSNPTTATYTPTSNPGSGS